jgi:signal transduction histidine kinase
MNPSYEELYAKIEELSEALRAKEEKSNLQHQEILLAKIKAEENEKLFRTLVETAAGTIGQDFFDHIVIKLAQWLDVECVVIGQMSGDNRIYCTPMYLDGKISYDFSYDLQDTPCDITTRKGFCQYDEDAINSFPKDKILVDLGGVGYVGTALYNKEGISNGVICAVSRKKLHLPPQTKDILKVIGSRVSAEIERKKALLDLENSEAELRESNATKDKLFSVIGHDLKNPFNSILGFTHLLISNFGHYEPRKQKKMLENIHSAAENAYNLLENLLKWSMAQQGFLKYSASKIRLSAFMEENIKNIMHLANNKNISVDMAIDEKIIVNADKNMLSTVIRNILVNAIKFTHEGGQINISGLPLVHDKKNIEISVTDNGIGIESTELDKIFQIDYSTSGTKTEKGTGLGLIICREFMKIQKGSIRAESTTGKGSSFILTIPSVH